MPEPESSIPILLTEVSSPTRDLFQRITAEIGKIFVGQSELVLGTLVALFSNGHVLIESVPGLGKTLFVRALGRVLGCRFGRIQFTADLMPSDITGRPDLRHEDPGVPLHPRPRLHAVAAGRRDQPLAGQDARRAAGNHAGIPRHGRADQPRHRAAVPGPGHAEPGRIGRHLQSARGPVGSLHVQARRSTILRARRKPASWRCTACRSIWTSGWASCRR